MIFSSDDILRLLKEYNIATVAKKLGIPVEEVRKHVAAENARRRAAERAANDPQALARYEESLRLAVLRQNALLRSWAALGLPLPIGGRVNQWGPDPRLPHAVVLELRCGECGRHGLSAMGAGKEAYPTDLLLTDLQLSDELKEAEESILRRFSRQGCKHPQRMLKPPPPEFWEIAKLELLA